MTNEVVVLVSSVIVLVFGAGAEVLLPKVLGAGFPVLMTAVQFFAVRRPAVSAAMFAIAAGAILFAGGVTFFSRRNGRRRQRD